MLSKWKWKLNEVCAKETILKTDGQPSGVPFFFWIVLLFYQYSHTVRNFTDSMLDLYRLHVTFCIDPDWKLQKVKGISPVLKLYSQNTFCTYTELNLYFLIEHFSVSILHRSSIETALIREGKQGFPLRQLNWLLSHQAPNPIAST